MSGDEHIPPGDNLSGRLLEAVEVCLSALEMGASLESCVQLYPDLADELRPVLEAARAAGSLAVGGDPTTGRQQPVPAAAMNRSRTHLLGLAAQWRPAQSRRGGSLGAGAHAMLGAGFWKHLLRLPRQALVALVIALALVLTSGGLVAASAQSLPGEALYPVKRAVESLRVQLAPSIESKHAIEVNYRHQRVAEVQELITLGRSQLVSYEGVVEETGPERWRVGGLTVLLTPATIVIGEIAPGMLVEVEGQTRPDGWVAATELHLREYQFAGWVEQMGPETWVISTIPLQVNRDSQISPGIRLDDEVLVLVRSEDDGRLYILAVLQLGGPLPTIMPLGSPTPSVTPTMTPTATSTPTATPTETPEPEEVELTEDSSSEEGDGSDATETAEPQETETPGDDGGDSGATETVEPQETETPGSEASETPEPQETETPEPTDAGEVTETPGP